MASPTIVTADSVTHCQSSTTPTLNVPTNSNTGDTLIIILGIDVNETVTSGPSGWTEFFNLQRASANCSIVGYWKESDGAEPSTVGITLNDFTRTASFGMRITGAADPDTSPPEATTADIGAANPDAPDITPTGGPKDFLYITALNAVSAETFSSLPSGFSNHVENACHGSGPHMSMGDNETTNTSSSTPGTWGYTFGGYALATIAVHPAGAAAGGLVVPRRRVIHRTMTAR